MTISIAIERYMSVCRPTHRSQYAHLLILSPIIFSILYNIPNFFEIVQCSRGEIYRTMLTHVDSKDRPYMETSNVTGIQLFFSSTNDTITVDGFEEAEGDNGTLCDPYNTRTTNLRNNKWYILSLIHI